MKTRVIQLKAVNALKLSHSNVKHNIIFGVHHINYVLLFNYPGLYPPYIKTAENSAEVSLTLNTIPRVTNPLNTLFSDVSARMSV